MRIVVGWRRVHLQSIINIRKAIDLWMKSKKEKNSRRNPSFKHEQRPFILERTSNDSHRTRRPWPGRIHDAALDDVRRGTDRRSDGASSKTGSEVAVDVVLKVLRLKELGLEIIVPVKQRKEGISV